jgi:hypothetical protein
MALITTRTDGSLCNSCAHCGIYCDYKYLCVHLCGCVHVYLLPCLQLLVACAHRKWGPFMQLNILRVLLQWRHNFSDTFLDCLNDNVGLKEDGGSDTSSQIGAGVDRRSKWTFSYIRPQDLTECCLSTSEVWINLYNEIWKSWRRSSVVSLSSSYFLCGYWNG